MKESLLMRPTDAAQYLGIRRQSIYEKLNTKSKYFDETFPRPIKLGPRAVAFKVEDLDIWIASRPATVAKGR
ncbi:MAG: AlpA family phage regulatory protein [Saprospiraceae bacterium]|nr:AlpA family phage regulatory protein [Saprospiraceae bacterium]